MKRSTPSVDEKLKKIRIDAQDEKEELAADEDHGTGFVNLDDNLLYEILKHIDARSLAMSACVSKLWNRTALDERLWELICTRHSSQLGCGTQQLRSVVLALGGFRRLHSLYLWPLSKPSSSSTSSAMAIPQPRLTTAFSMKQPPKNINNNNNGRFGKDEVQLSLSLLSIRYFEKMNFPVKDK